MKEARIQLRLSSEERKKFEIAEAMLNFASLSEFFRHAAHALAEKTFQDERTITLSDNEREQFLDALENPPSPSDKLKDAMGRHRDKLRK